MPKDIYEVVPVKNTPFAAGKDVFGLIYRKDDGYNAGSKHAITGYKVRDNLFVTIYHEHYFPTQILVHFKEEEMGQPTDFYADIDENDMQVFSTIPGVENAKDYFQLIYMVRYGEVVRDDC